MSAGLAERIVVYDKSEGSILQCGVLWGVCKKTIRFILLVGSKVFFSPLLYPPCFLAFVSAVPASGFFPCSGTGVCLFALANKNPDVTVSC